MTKTGTSEQADDNVRAKRHLLYFMMHHSFGSLVLTLRDNGISLANALQRLELELPLLEDVERRLRAIRARVPVEQPAHRKHQEIPPPTVQN